MSTLKLLSWNINGLRAAIKKGLWDKIHELNPDIFCVQETKSDEVIMLSGILKHPEYQAVFHSAQNRKGYSGVATFTKNSSQNQANQVSLLDEQNIAIGDSNNSNNSNPLQLVSTQIGLGLPEFDEEGRLVLNKYNFQGQQFTLLNGYFPQGGRGPVRIDYKIRFYQAVFELTKKLQASGEKVIICGDLNTTVGDIDLARPKENRQTTGCLPEEREALDLFLKNGFLDSFRYFYPDTVDKYTYWDQITRARERNVGWRIDYFLIDRELEKNLKSATILEEVMGSDHCPIAIELEF